MTDHTLFDAPRADTRGGDAPQPGSALSSMTAASEDAFWSTAYRSQPYHRPGTTYADYAPAYRMGYNRWFGGRREACDFTTLEDEAEWGRVKGSSQLGWLDAQAAARAAWQRVRRWAGEPA